MTKTTETALYKWGEFREMENLSSEDFNRLERLEDETLLGFLIRDEDRGKVFMADPLYIDEDEYGTAVKFAYAIEPERIK
jgi:hypothetical protein